jgi:peptidoglycan/xylan/chitin deacetylase (PgdA/CDA1 family)
MLLALVSLTFPCRECLSGDESHRVYACGKSDGNELALTFDDGPHPEYTPQILDILKNNGVKATFFVIGKNAELYPELVERMVREGHTVGNHTYTHRPIHEQKEEGFYRDVLKNRSLLLGFSVKDGLFRPPGGVCDEKVLALGKKLDYDVILWTVDTEDWKAPATERIVNAVLQNGITDRTIQRSRININKAEFFCQETCDRTFARTRRTIDRDIDYAFVHHNASSHT